MKYAREFGLIFKAISHLLHNQEIIMRNVCKKNTSAIDSTNELSVLSATLSHEYYKQKEDSVSIVDILNDAKKRTPNKTILVETFAGNIALNLEEVDVYEGKNGEIVIRER